MIGVGAIGYLLIDRMTMHLKVFLFSETEGLFEPINIDATTPKCLHSTKRDFRFFRTSKSYKNRFKSELLWLAKMGKGYVFRLKQGEKDKAEKLGSLWEGLNVILGEDICNGFTDYVKDKLMDSKIYLTVELEQPPFPVEYEELTEQDVKNENAQRMSSVMFAGMKDQLKEDYIKIIFILGTGIAIALVAIRLGLM